MCVRSDQLDTVIIVIGDKHLRGPRSDRVRAGIAHYWLEAVYVARGPNWPLVLAHELLHLLCGANRKEQDVKRLERALARPLQLRLGERGCKVAP